MMSIVIIVKFPTNRYYTIVSNEVVYNTLEFMKESKYLSNELVLKFLNQIQFSM